MSSYFDNQYGGEDADDNFKGGDSDDDSSSLNDSELEEEEVEEEVEEQEGGEDDEEEEEERDRAAALAKMQGRVPKRAYSLGVLGHTLADRIEPLLHEVVLLAAHLERIVGGSLDIGRNVQHFLEPLALVQALGEPETGAGDGGERLAPAHQIAGEVEW